MFGPSWIQLLIVLLVVLLLFGSRLPALARSLGQSLNEFKRGMKEIEDKSDKPSDGK
jgi:sec-independent protein translocase protein TatA